MQIVDEAAKGPVIFFKGLLQKLEKEGSGVLICGKRKSCQLLINGGFLKKAGQKPFQKEAELSP